MLFWCFLYLPHHTQCEPCFSRRWVVLARRRALLSPAKTTRWRCVCGNIHDDCDDHPSAGAGATAAATVEHCSEAAMQQIWN